MEKIEKTTREFFNNAWAWTLELDEEKKAELEKKILLVFYDNKTNASDFVHVMNRYKELYTFDIFTMIDRFSQEFYHALDKVLECNTGNFLKVITERMKSKKMIEDWHLIRPKAETKQEPEEAKIINLKDDTNGN